MARYRLPEDLGGGEVEADENWGGCAGGRPEYTIGEITVLMPPGRPMDKVAPPLPPVPPPGSVVRATVVRAGITEGHGPWVLERCADHADGDGWYAAGITRRYEWAELHSPTPLVPDPFAESVTLPWGDWSEFGTAVQVKTGETNPEHVCIAFSGALAALSPAKARTMARALRVAADAAEAGAS